MSLLDPSTLAPVDVLGDDLNVVALAVALGGEPPKVPAVVMRTDVPVFPQEAFVIVSGQPVTIQLAPRRMQVRRMASLGTHTAFYNVDALTITNSFALEVVTIASNKAYVTVDIDWFLRIFAGIVDDLQARASFGPDQMVARMLARAGRFDPANLEEMTVVVNSRQEEMLFYACWASTYLKEGGRKAMELPDFNPWRIIKSFYNFRWPNRLEEEG